MSQQRSLMKWCKDATKGAPHTSLTWLCRQEYYVTSFFTVVVHDNCDVWSSFHVEHQTAVVSLRCKCCSKRCVYLLCVDISGWRHQTAAFIVGEGGDTWPCCPRAILTCGTSGRDHESPITSPYI
ncbi:hypothetical protein E2C01_033530 [Portunus trituberculatus]|uniref:Uncharacterized protein n=1 Tax=Portunus trituberculatus TaxID=210409 RepID=A0A5B7F359_PORTR|nr:hypothetical protein [Portunus trituberculatus]